MCRQTTKKKSTDIINPVIFSVSAMKIGDGKMGRKEKRSKKNKEMQLIADLAEKNERVIEITLRKIEEMKNNKQLQSEFRIFMVKQIYEQALWRRWHFSQLQHLGTRRIATISSRSPNHTTAILNKTY